MDSCILDLEEDWGWSYRDVTSSWEEESIQGKGREPSDEFEPMSGKYLGVWTTECQGMGDGAEWMRACAHHMPWLCSPRVSIL